MDGIASDAWHYLPDVVEGETGECAAPADGVRDSTENSKDDVAEGFTHVKTFVRKLPHAVDTFGVFGFSDTFLIGHLEKTKQSCINQKL